MQQLNNTKQQCTTIHNTSQQPLHNDALNNDARNQWRVKSQQWPERDGEEEQKKYAKQWTDKNQITSNRPKKTATTTMHCAAKHIKMKHKSALHRNKMVWILIKKRQNAKARSVQCNRPANNVLKQWLQHRGRFELQHSGFPTHWGLNLSQQHATIIYWYSSNWNGPTYFICV